MTISKMKYVFIGGFISSGTTVTVKALRMMAIGGGTGKYWEGRHDPRYPNKWGDGQKTFERNKAREIKAWIKSFAPKDCFIEKSPGREKHFQALQKLFGANNTYFLMLQRNPVQCVQSAIRRWSKDDIKSRKQIWKKDLWRKRFKFATKLHKRISKKLKHFRYVRYDTLCGKPVGYLKGICEFLDEDIPKGRIVKVCNKLKIERKHSYNYSDVPNLTVPMRDALKELCDLWGYKIPKELII